jgi:ribonuclease T
MNTAKEEVYISVDIEASGPIPGEYSLLSIGASVIGNPNSRFYVELQPISDKVLPEALAVSGLSMKELETRGEIPQAALKKFSEWIESNSEPGVPVFVGFNACFDWAFVNWYFYRFLGANPFGFAGLDIKAYYMGRVGCKWAETTANRLPQDLRTDTPLTHNALDDAIAQGEIFRKLLGMPPIGSADS